MQGVHRSSSEKRDTAASIIKHLTPTRWCQMRSLTDFKSKKSEKTASVFLPQLLTNLILFGVKNPVGVNYWCQKS